MEENAVCKNRKNRSSNAPMLYSSGMDRSLRTGESNVTGVPGILKNCCGGSCHFSAGRAGVKLKLHRYGGLSVCCQQVGFLMLSCCKMNEARSFFHFREERTRRGKLFRPGKEVSGRKTCRYIKLSWLSPLSLNARTRLMLLLSSKRFPPLT